MRCYGVARVFYLLKINKMESKNDWYLISVSRSDFKESGNIWMVAYYSNGLIERHRRFQMGEFIPTIIEHEQGTTIL